MSGKSTTKPLLLQTPGVTEDFNPDEDTLYGLARSTDEDTERHSILVLAIEDAFASNRDRIVYEADLTIDSFDSMDRNVRLLKPVGSGLSAALGFIGARDRLQQDHHVVLVANPVSVGAIFQQVDQCSIDHLLNCVIVTPIESRSQLYVNSEILQRFELRGGTVLDLTSTRNLLQLAAGFRDARKHDGPGLVLIDAAMAPAWQQSTDSSVGKRTSPSSPSVAERVLLSSVSTEIARFTREDRRSTPVLFDALQPWRKLVAEFGERVLVFEDQDIDESLAWCAALAEGGCHPIILLNPRQLNEHANALRENVFRPEHSLTVIVVDSVTNSVSTIASVMTPFLSEVHVVMPGTPDEVVPLTKAVLRSEGPALLYLPITSDLFNPNRDRWLDFRAAAGLRERAGKERPGTPLPLMLGSPEREYRQILNRPLTPEAQRWVNEYDRVGQRGLYLWRWAAHAIQLLELASVDPDWRRRNRDTKFLAAMFNVLLDDVADDWDGGDLLQNLMRLPRGGRPDIRESDPHAGYAVLTSAVWDELWQRAARYPRYHEFADLLRYDFWQLCNTIEYSDLVLRQPEMINSVEHAMYSPHGMMVTCAATMDLMCSPRFDANELGPLREALWHAACMARYGNLLTTWRREIRRGDFTSGVFTKAIENGWLSRGELQQMTLEEVEQRVSFVSVEREFLNRWQTHRACVLQMRERVKSCSLRSYVEGLDRLLASEYASSGCK
jgi:hypothetical protein